MRKRANELKPGDKIIRGPWRGGLENLTVKSVMPYVSVVSTDGRVFQHDAESGFEVEEPNITVEVPVSEAQRVIKGDPHAIIRLCHNVTVAVGRTGL